MLNREPTNALTRQAFRELAGAAAEVAERPDIVAVILFGGHDILGRRRRTGVAHPRPARGRGRRPGAPGGDRRRRRHPEAHRRRNHRLRAGQRAEPGPGRRLADQRRQRQVRRHRDPGRAGARRRGGDRLARAVGPARAKELAFSGRFVDAKEALRLHLVDELVAPDDVYDAAVAWAGRFVDASPAALAGSRR